MRGLRRNAATDQAARKFHQLRNDGRALYRVNNCVYRPASACCTSGLFRTPQRNQQNILAMRTTMDSRIVLDDNVKCIKFV